MKYPEQPKLLHMLKCFIYYHPNVRSHALYLIGLFPVILSDQEENREMLFHIFRSQVSDIIYS